MKTDQNAVHAFATLRFAGDQLDPHQITELLRVEPTLAYRKGESYRIGPRRKRVGKTGLWIFSTDGLFPQHEVRAHVDAITELVANDSRHPARDKKLQVLREIVEERALSPLVTIFWHGPQGTPAPMIDPAFRDLIARIHGQVEEDFDVDDGGEPFERLLVSA
jgi:hypothetical protein